MYLKLSFLTFILFAGHILLGSLWGISLVGDIGELIILLCSSVLFVIAILQAETRVKPGQSNS